MEKLGPWWRQRQLLIVLLGYASVVLMFNALDELIPLFASAPRSSVRARSWSRM